MLLSPLPFDARSVSYPRRSVALNLLLLWSYLTSAETALGRKLPNLEHMTGGLGFPGLNGFSRQLYGIDANNFGPRFGFAYRLTPTTVLRGAFGVMYGPSYAQAAGNALAAPRV